MNHFNACASYTNAELNDLSIAFAKTACLFGIQIEKYNHLYDIIAHVPATLYLGMLAFIIISLCILPFLSRQIACTFGKLANELDTIQNTIIKICHLYDPSVIAVLVLMGMIAIVKYDDLYHLSFDKTMLRMFQKNETLTEEVIRMSIDVIDKVTISLKSM